MKKKLQARFSPYQRVDPTKSLRHNRRLRKKSLKTSLIEEVSKLNHQFDVEFDEDRPTAHVANICEHENVPDAAIRVEELSLHADINSDFFIPPNPQSTAMIIEANEEPPLRGESKQPANAVDDFKQKLAISFIESSLTFKQGNRILKCLRTLDSMKFLPADMRTLLKTPRVCSDTIYKVSPGEYLHIGVEKAIIKCLNKNNVTLPLPEPLLIDCSTDGIEMNKKYQIWPIQIKLVDIKDSAPEVVGVYVGRRKPNAAKDFLEFFISDVKNILNAGGIKYNGKTCVIKLRAFVADLPARALVLCHKGHNSENACSRCLISGTSFKTKKGSTMTFFGANNELRNHNDYINLIDKKHHTEITPLSQIPGFDVVLDTPFDPMHTVYSGVMAKLLYGWTTNKYGNEAKLSQKIIKILSERCEIAARYCPDEFSRRPESLTYLKKYKATQFRQFLLHHGISVLRGLVSNETYTHFLLLSISIRFLVTKNCSDQKLFFAEKAIEKFIKNCDKFYNNNIVTLVVHTLIHLVSDVRRFGALDSYSAFDYENNMTFFHRFYRKPGLPLQQISKRLNEQEKNEYLEMKSETVPLKFYVKKTVGPVPLNVKDQVLGSYRKIGLNLVKRSNIGVDARNNCIILKDGSICLVYNIVKLRNDDINLVVKKFSNANDLFDIGVGSSESGVFRCSKLSELFAVSLSEFAGKCFRVPYYDLCSDESDDEDDNNQSDSYDYDNESNNEKLEFIVTTLS